MQKSVSFGTIAVSLFAGRGGLERNLYLAYLHGGEQMLIGLFLAGVIVLIGLPLLLYVWLWHTTVSELKLALVYFMSVAVLCIVSAFATNDPASVLLLMAYFFSFILTLPWNVLAGWALSEARGSGLSNREFSAVMLFGAGLNAVLLYLAAAKMRRLIR